jgi:hypothetical protein
MEAAAVERQTRGIVVSCCGARSHSLWAQPQLVLRHVHSFVPLLFLLLSLACLAASTDNLGRRSTQLGSHLIGISSLSQRIFQFTSVDLSS